MNWSAWDLKCLWIWNFLNADRMPQEDDSTLILCDRLQLKCRCDFKNCIKSPATATGARQGLVQPVQERKKAAKLQNPSHLCNPDNPEWPNGG